jgi:hypothetical protein
LAGRLRYHPAKESPMFRISLLLWLIALAALNLTLLKYTEAVIDLSPKFAGLIGLMPLFDLFARLLSRICGCVLAPEGVRDCVAEPVLQPVRSGSRTIFSSPI